MTGQRVTPAGTHEAARRWWLAYEPIHAVVYFDPGCRAAMGEIGLRGFWMGYFAARSAPLGPVGPDAVTAAFFNFHPAMARRALPDAWSLASPESVWAARGRSAATALRQAAPQADAPAADLVRALRRAFDGIGDAGRPLFAATRSMGSPDDPVEALWYWCTCLREHRGDGHVAALTTADLDGCEALVLFAASEGLPDDLFQASRGWSPEEWVASRERLERRGLVDTSGITAAGRELRRSVEMTTDTLAWRVIDGLAGPHRSTLFDGLSALATAVAAVGVIDYPNPMGLPAPGTDRASGAGPA